MIFKKELCITRSLTAQNEIRMILSQNNIKYEIETIDRVIKGYRIAADRGTDLVYKIIVKKKDYRVALSLIRNIRLA